MNTKNLIVWRRIRFSTFLWCVFLAALTATASAQTFSGTVTNGTTQKPAGGDRVVLLDPSNGMRELGRSQSDSNGSFRFGPGQFNQALILRVIHQGAVYYKVVPPNSTSVHVDVYDVSKRLKGVAVTADVMRVQVKGDSLQVVRLFAVQNNSAPPQTQVSEHNFEFYLPDGAKIDHCMAKSADGQPVRTFPLPLKKKNLHAFLFPLRPGETQFQVLFHMPYRGAVTINPRPVYGVEHLVVILPKEMHFTAASGAAFQPMRDPRQSDAIVQVASNTTVGQTLTFTLSGTGALADTRAENPGSVQPATVLNTDKTVQESRARAEAPPTIAPNVSAKFHWYILAGLVVLLAAGTISIAYRSTKRRVSDSVPREVKANRLSALRVLLCDLRGKAFNRRDRSEKAAEDAEKNSVAVSRAMSDPVGGSNLPFSDLKEQLFRLEVEHKENRISQQEYEKAIIALRQDLHWATTRKAVQLVEEQCGNKKAMHPISNLSADWERR